MRHRPIKGSGDGSRPSTSGGVDNMGAAESFTGEKTAAGDDVSGPAPHERMQDKRSNVESTKHEDSAAFDLTEDLTPETNQEKTGTEPERHSETREEAIQRAAYQAYERRGCEPGHETEDWLGAEAEFDRQLGSKR